MEKWKKEGKINLSSFVFCPTIYLDTLNVHTKFEDSGSHRRSEICNRKFAWENKKLTNKGNDKQQHADSLLHNTTCHTQHLYQISKSQAVVPENLSHKFPYVLHWSDRWKKKAKIHHSILFSFPRYTWPLSRCIQNLKTLALIGAEISIMEIFIGEREKWTNKGNDKREEADSLYNRSYPTFVPNFKILSVIVPEKSDEKKKFKHK